MTHFMLFFKHASRNSSCKLQTWQIPLDYSTKGACEPVLSLASLHHAEFDRNWALAGIGLPYEQEAAHKRQRLIDECFVAPLLS